MRLPRYRPSLLFSLGACLLLVGVSLYGATVRVDAAVGETGDGSADHPFRTIQEGIDHARPSDTVNIRRGVYREQVRVHAGGTEGKPLVIEADPIGSVTVDGADTLTGWEKDKMHHAIDDSGIWTCRAYRSPYLPMSNDFNLRTAWLKEGGEGTRQVELVSRNDMVWLDGHFLEEVDSRAQLRFGTFWVDRESGALALPLPGADKPGQHLVEVAQRGPLFTSDEGCSYVHLRGIHFTRSAAGFEHAALEIGSPSARGWIAEDNVSDWSSYAGIKVEGRDNQILRNVASDNGDEGIQGTIQDTLLDGNASLRNNWKGIRDTFEAGGGKFTQSSGVVVRHHLAAYNRGPGLWFDINNKAITVENSKFHDNTYAGLFVEISVGPTRLLGNASWANQGAGIAIGESSHVLIENNILADNGYGIELRNIQGRHDSAFGSWQTSDVAIRKNVFLRNARAGIADTACYLDPRTERVTSDDNVFWDNDPLWWRIPDPGGPFARVSKPVQAYATVNGGWLIKFSQSQGAFGGLEEHSRYQNPGLSGMEPVPDPVAGP